MKVYVLLNFFSNHNPVVTTNYKAAVCAGINHAFDVQVITEKDMNNWLFEVALVYDETDIERLSDIFSKFTDRTGMTDLTIMEGEMDDTQLHNRVVDKCVASMVLNLKSLYKT